MSNSKVRPGAMLDRMRATVASSAAATAAGAQTDAQGAEPQPAPAAVEAQQAPAEAQPQRRRAPRPKRTTAPAPVEAPELRSTVRYTLVLERPAHRALHIAALDLGLSASAVVRALLSEMAEDPQLAGRVAQRAAGRPAEPGRDRGGRNR